MPPVSPCGTQPFSGSDIAETHVIEMGKNAGTFSFYYDTYEIHDAITVSYEGSPLFETDCVGESTTTAIEYAGTSSRVTVQVTPNCVGNTKGTGWTFTAHCPQ